MISNENLWFASRATGMVSVVLLTVVMILGMVINTMRHPHSQTPTVVMALHRWLSTSMVIFLALHVATAIAETYVSIDLIAAFVPLSSRYEPVWVGLGAVAVDLLLAVMITSVFRQHLPERAWKWVHLSAYLLWPLALVHGYQLGTADQMWMRAVTIGCAVLGVAALMWCMFHPNADLRRRRDSDARQWR